MSLLRGLSSTEAQSSLARNGPNELPSRRASSVWSSLWWVLKEPMVLLLLACAALYFVIGEAVDAAILLSSVFVVGGIGFFQELKTTQHLAALRRLNSPHALVRRDGQTIRIFSRDLVVNDLLVLHDGDRVAADAKIVEANELLVDESLLTGEALPVLKNAECSVGVSAEENRLYSGSLVLRGSALALVTATGAATRIGQINRSLNDINESLSPLQKQAVRLAKYFGFASLAVCVIVVFAYGYLRGDWVAALLSGLALSVSLIPEEFPLIMTVFFAMGAWRMSRWNVLTRRIAAIESLGSVQVLCTDKTGTLTLNQMGIARTFSVESGPLSEKDLLSAFYQASDDHPVDPMEMAVAERVENETRGQTLKTFGLRPELLAFTQIRKIGNEMVGICKGAPEAVLGLCSVNRELKRSIEERAEQWASEGTRVLAVARAKNLPVIPASPQDCGYEFLGLVGFSDPPRPEVPAAIELCRKAGIKVVMITGDYPGTAMAIAKAIRLSGAELPEVMNGDEIELLSDHDLGQEIRNIDVFARISPEQKLRIVRAYQARSFHVAMTGDGVNDAPSLRAADVGIAMGGRGTDVAREASDLVLLDDKFSTIVEAIRMGRTIFANIRRATEFVVSVHVPVALVALAQSLFHLPILLFPLHVVLLELIIDPSCTLLFEAEAPSPSVMQEAPRSPSEPLLSASQIPRAIAQGLFLFLPVLLIFIFSHELNLSDAQLRALVFAALSMSLVGLVLGKLSKSRPLFQRPGNPWVLPMTIAPLGVMLIIMFVPGIKELLKFEPVSWSLTGLSVAAGLLAGILPSRLDGDNSRSRTSRSVPLVRGAT